MSLPPPTPSVTTAFRRLLLPVFAPSLVSATAQQAMSVLLPLYFLDLGFTAAAAAAIYGMRGLGMVAFDIPAGLVAGRLGDKAAIVAGLACLAVVSGAVGMVSGRWPTSALMVGYGAALSLYLVGRLSYVSDTVAAAARGRVMAVLAGIQRAGALGGPVLAGLIAEHLGFGTTFLAVGVALGAAAALPLCFARAVRLDHLHPLSTAERIVQVLRHYRYAFATAGFCAFVLMLLRTARLLLIPLYGSALGLGIGTIGTIVSLSALFDLMLFYPAGEVMDRRGRKWTLVPAMALMSITFLAFPLIEGRGLLVFAAIVLGVANGWSTGVVMTIGADLAPSERRSEFIGVWRIAADAGATAGPFLIAAVISVAAVTGAASAIGVVGLLGTAVAIGFVRETLRPRA